MPVCRVSVHNRGANKLGTFHVCTCEVTVLAVGQGSKVRILKGWDTVVVGEALGPSQLRHADQENRSGNSYSEIIL